MLLTPDGLPRVIQRIRMGYGSKLDFLLFSGRTTSIPVGNVAHVCGVSMHSVLGILYSDDPTPLYDTMDEWALRHWYPELYPTPRQVRREYPIITAGYEMRTRLGESYE